VPPPPLPPIFLGYDLDNIQGALTINGGGGTNALAIDDDFNFTGYTYNLTRNTLDRFGAVSIATITFNQMSTVDLYEPSSPQANLTNVFGTALGTTVTVHPGDGDDSLNVFSLDQIQGPLDFMWSSGFKGLGVNDTAATGMDTYTLNPFDLQRTGAIPIHWNHDLDAVELEVGVNVAELVYIPTIDAGTQVTVFGEPSGTTIQVGTSGPGQGEDLTAIQGSLTVMGAVGTSVLLEDQKATTGRVYTAGGFEFDAAVNSTPIPPAFCKVKYFNVPNLFLDSGAMGNQTFVTGVALGTSVVVNAESNDQVTVGDDPNHTLHTLQQIFGVVGVRGQPNTSVQLTLDDGNGSLNSTYVLKSNEVDDGPVHVFYSNLASLTVQGSGGGDFYVVQDLLPPPQCNITASGVGNTLVGPNLDNTWVVSGANAGTLNGNISFSDMQNLFGLSGKDTLDFSQIGSKVTATLTQDGPVDGVQGKAAGFFDNFYNFDALIGNSAIGHPTSKLDGTSYAGNFAHMLTLSKFDSVILKVAGDFDGTLDASAEGTPAQPIGSIEVDGSVNKGAVIKTNFLNTFRVPNPPNGMDGVLKGFGLVSDGIGNLVPDTTDPTIKVINIPGTFGIDGQIIAPVLGNVFIGQADGLLQETEPSADMQLLQITGSLTAPGIVQAGSIADLEVGQDLAGTVNVTGLIGTLNVVHKLIGRVKAGNIGSAFIGDFTATASLQAGSIVYLQVFEQTVTPGEDPNLDGNVSVSGPITTLRVDKNLSGSVTAASIGSGFVGGDFTGKIVVGSMGSFTVLGANLGMITASPTLTTQASAGGLLGTVTLIDTATLSGGFSVNGGTITFTLTAPDNSTMTETVAVTNGDNTYTTPTGIVATMPGVYRWSARYSGNATNNPAVDNGQNETTTVTGFSISGSLYDDLTENGFSSDDPLLSTADTNYVSVTINLYMNGGATPFATTATDANGNYSFNGLGAGSYSVSEVVLAGWKETANSSPTTPGHAGAATTGPSATGSITATDGGSSTLNDFDNFKFGQITGTVYHDVTGNGWSADDTPLASSTQPVTFQLYKNGVLLTTTTQNSAGVYAFSNLDYGSYYVAEVTPMNWVLTANSTSGGPLGHTGGATQGPSGNGAVVVSSGVQSTATDFDDAHVNQGVMTGQFGIGYWKNHASTITAGDLQLLSTLYLRNPNGSRFTFPYTNFATLSRAQLTADQTAFSNFLGNANGKNPANMLSAQLAALELDVRWGSAPAAGDTNLTSLSANAVIYDPALAQYAGSPQMIGLYNGGFITIANLMSTANSELALFGNPTSGGFDYNFENELENAVSLANENQDFVV
jgi:hypothetical protein